MEAGPPRDDDSHPATTGQLRNLRRWLLVTGVWAVAATAIAVIALVVANRDDDQEDRARTAGQIEQVQRQLNQRLDDLERQIEDLPTSDDVSNLDNRLGQVEDDAAKTSDQAERLSGRIEDLETQVDELEQSGTGTETTETTP
jgi:septal ring factor EnvC (AmiA/AmiB activator)